MDSERPGKSFVSIRALTIPFSCSDIGLMVIGPTRDQAWFRAGLPALGLDDAHYALRPMGLPTFTRADALRALLEPLDGRASQQPETDLLEESPVPP